MAAIAASFRPERYQCLSMLIFAPFASQAMISRKNRRDVLYMPGAEALFRLSLKSEADAGRARRMDAVRARARAEGMP